MKKLLVATLTLCGYQAVAQTSFTASSNAFDGCYNPYVSFFDADGDGDKDFIYCGAAPAGASTKLMLNDGSGNFTASNQAFPSVWIGSLLTGDINGDGDIDVYVTGANDFLDESLNGLYDNNGSGVFTLNTNSTIAATGSGDGALFDCDNDGDLDLLVTGGDFQSQLVYTKLYINDGAGNFTESSENLGGMAFSFATLKTGDVDADGDKDLAVMGISYLNSTPGSVVTSLYLNNGSGSFTLTNQAFTGLGGGDLELGDIDNDGDLDMIITGSDQAEDDRFFIYKNNGQGIFTVDNTSGIPALFSSAIELVDADNDADLDLFYSGGPLDALEFKYYDNQGGVFTEVLGHPFVGVSAGFIESEDVNGDGFKDIFATGALADVASGGVLAKLYLSSADASIHELTALNFDVFPNPVQGDALQFSLQDLQLEEAYSIEIIDLSGKTFYATSINQENNGMVTLDLKNMVPGCYTVKLKSAHQLFISRFIKR